MVDYKYYYYGKLTGEVTLEETNVPIGWLSLSTRVYFNLNPNPADVGDTVTLNGILVDEFSQPLSNETLRLYARPR